LNRFFNLLLQLKLFHFVDNQFWHEEKAYKLFLRLFLMKIEIFEIKGSSFSNELSTNLDVLILDLYKRRPDIKIKKIDVLNKDLMKDHKDIIKIISKEGLDVLPLIKFNGKIIKEQELEKLLKKVV